MHILQDAGGGGGAGLLGLGEGWINPNAEPKPSCQGGAGQSDLSPVRLWVHVIGEPNGVRTSVIEAVVAHKATHQTGLFNAVQISLYARMCSRLRAPFHRA